jgi:hypothetical protein
MTAQVATVSDSVGRQNGGPLSAFQVRRVVWLALAPILAVLAALAVGAMPTRTLGGGGAMAAMGVACGASILATVLGSLPVVWVARQDPTRVPAMVMGAVLLRMVLLAAIVGPIAAFSALPWRVLLLWVAISYLVALAGETLALTVFIRRMRANG